MGEYRTPGQSWIDSSLSLCWLKIHSFVNFTKIMSNICIQMRLQVIGTLPAKKQESRQVGSVWCTNVCEVYTAMPPAKRHSYTCRDKTWQTCIITERKYAFSQFFCKYTYIHNKQNQQCDYDTINANRAYFYILFLKVFGAETFSRSYRPAPERKHEPNNSFLGKIKLFFILSIIIYFYKDPEG